MNTLIAQTARAARLGLTSRRPWGLAAALLVAGALAAGCASTSSSSSGPYPSPPASSGGSFHPGEPNQSSSPVPTVSGGPVAAGAVACVGWPSGATSGSLPASFAPVSVERCVTGTTAIPGKGLWTTATLERSTSDLSRLVSALRQPNAARPPGKICPALAMIPPQVVLTNAAGQQLIPRIPLGECGLPATAVATALNSLRWQPVSVRLIAQVRGTSTPAAPASGGTPATGHVQPQ